MTLDEIIRHNTEVKKVIEERASKSKYAIGVRNWRGYEMRLLTDGRDTEETAICDADGAPDPEFKGQFWVCAKFACPCCGEYTIFLDSFTKEDKNVKAAECLNDRCRCCFMADRPYLQWEQGEKVYVHW